MMSGLVIAVTIGGAAHASAALRRTRAALADRAIVPLDRRARQRARADGEIAGARASTEQAASAASPAVHLVGEVAGNPRCQAAKQIAQGSARRHTSPSYGGTKHPRTQ